MLAVFVRIGVVIMIVLSAAMASAFGIGAATGMAIALCAWLIVRPLADIVWWVFCVLALGALLHITSHLAVFASLVLLLVIFDVVRQYLMLTNTQSRAISGTVALLGIIALAYGLAFAGTHAVVWRWEWLFGLVGYSVVMLVVMEWIMRRAERIVALFAHGGDVRRHI